MRQGETITIDITSINSEGEGIARHGEKGIVVFVPGALLGERAVCRVVKVGKTYATARVLEIITSSDERVTPPCPIFGKCGGCKLQHASYALQLEIKASILRDALRRIGHIEWKQPLACVPSPKQWGYRNKTTLPAQCVGSSRNKSFVSGYYERRSHRIVPFTTCAVLDPALERVIRDMIDFLSASGFTGYDEAKKTGEIRHVAARAYSSPTRSEILIGCVAAKDPDTRKYGKLKNMQQSLAKHNANLKGSVLNINTDETNFIWGPLFKSLSGNRFLRQQLGSYQFDVDLSAFFQINNEQTEQLFSHVQDLLTPFAPKKILELYSGVGSLTAYLAALGETVDAVEEWRPAAKLLLGNMELNGIGNVSLHMDAAEKFMQRAEAVYDAVVLDPPRSGCDEAVIAGIHRIAPKVIAYVSCNPATLARDIARLTADGAYNLEKLAAFDMFPQTPHVESVALLRKC